MFVSTMIFLPVSHVMNRNIYHHPVLRAILGAVTFVLCPIMFFVTLFMGKTHYFGLLPLTKMSGGEDNEGGYIMPLLYKILAIILHPFIEFNERDDDKVGYEKAIESLLAKPGAPVVNEELLTAAAAAGAKDTKAGWEEAMLGLVPLFATPTLRAAT